MLPRELIPDPRIAPSPRRLARFYNFGISNATNILESYGISGSIMVLVTIGTTSDVIIGRKGTRSKHMKKAIRTLGLLVVDELACLRRLDRKALALPYRLDERP